MGLNFNSTIRERKVIDILRDAAKNGKLGEFTVNALSIIGTRPVDEKPTKAATTSSFSSSDSMFLCVSVGIFNGYKIIAQCASVHFCFQYRIEPNMDVKTHCRFIHSVCLSICLSVSVFSTHLQCSTFSTSSSSSDFLKLVCRCHLVIASDDMCQSSQYLLFS